ncbi:hypothetical protein TNCV_4343291 [Trichonephila clavipes]|nr:hypothetical protein TNCV_4343291 [Trichonephila clavipes]
MHSWSRKTVRFSLQDPLDILIFHLRHLEVVVVDVTALTPENSDLIRSFLLPSNNVFGLIARFPRFHTYCTYKVPPLSQICIVMSPIVIFDYFLSFIVTLKMSSPTIPVSDNDEAQWRTQGWGFEVHRPASFQLLP